jgi:hypothetical protein
VSRLLGSVVSPSSDPRTASLCARAIALWTHVSRGHAHAPGFDTAEPRDIRDRAIFMPGLLLLGRNRSGWGTS